MDSDSSFKAESILLFQIIPLSIYYGTEIRPPPPLSLSFTVLLFLLQM